MPNGMRAIPANIATRRAKAREYVALVFVSDWVKGLASSDRLMSQIRDRIMSTVAAPQGNGAGPALVLATGPSAAVVGDTVATVGVAYSGATLRVFGAGVGKTYAELLEPLASWGGLTRDTIELHAVEIRALPNSDTARAQAAAQVDRNPARDVGTGVADTLEKTADTISVVAVAVIAAVGWYFLKGLKE